MGAGMAVDAGIGVQLGDHAGVVFRDNLEGVISCITVHVTHDAGARRGVAGGVGVLEDVGEDDEHPLRSPLTGPW